MIRIFNAVLVLVVIGAATFTYRVKHEAEATLGEIRETRAAIETQHELIDVLNADWAVLTSPARIQRLVDQYRDVLNLDVTAAHQIVTPQALPDPPVRDASDGIREIIAGELDDELTTGSIAREER